MEPICSSIYFNFVWMKILRERNCIACANSKQMKGSPESREAKLTQMLVLKHWRGKHLEKEGISNVWKGTLKQASGKDINIGDENIWKGILKEASREDNINKT